MDSEILAFSLFENEQGRRLAMLSKYEEGVYFRYYNSYLTNPFDLTAAFKFGLTIKDIVATTGKLSLFPGSDKFTISAAVATDSNTFMLYWWDFLEVDNLDEADFKVRSVEGTTGQIVKILYYVDKLEESGDETFMKSYLLMLGEDDSLYLITRDKRGEGEVIF